MAAGQVTCTNAHQWLATAYHEAGHAVVMLLLGRTLLWVELTSSGSGVARAKGISPCLAQLIADAERQRRVSPELLRRWREEIWISDAGAIAEAEFNLVSPETLRDGAFGDQMRKFALMPDEEQRAFIGDYFDRHIGQWGDLISEGCRRLFRMPAVSSMTRTLAEALLRVRRMDGEAAIDTLLANQARRTGQRDLFWVPLHDDLVGRDRNDSQPTQLWLL